MRVILTVDCAEGKAGHAVTVNDSYGARLMGQGRAKPAPAAGKRAEPAQATPKRTKATAEAEAKAPEASEAT